MPRVPLDLFIEVVDPAGARYKWDANQPPGSRLRDFGFRTKVGEGFSDANGTLARRIDLDYPDLQLVNDVIVTGADGSVAYEGRMSAMPRELGDSHSISVTLTGWMAHAKDRKFSEIYVDRDLNAWGPMSNGRKAARLASNLTPFDPEQTTDPTDSQAGVTTAFTGAWVSPYKPYSAAYYDAGPGLTLTQIAYSWKRESTNIDNANTSWSWFVNFAPDDKAAATEFSSDLRAAGPSSGTFSTSTPRRYAFVDLAYTATPAGGDGTRFGIAWYNLAAYGNHSLALKTGEPGQPAGVTPSDVIRDIAGRFCPQLNTSGVQNNDYVIQHLVFKDRTFPYDAFLEVNKYSLWHLGVWDNKTLTYRPYDLTDYDWEIRTDDPGTTFSPQGRSVDDLFNGVTVSYTDVLTGIKQTLTPDDTPELNDTNPENPWTMWGVDHWDEIDLSAPTLGAQAVQIGRMALADRNRPKAPGTITVKGYIKDRAGNEQPVWKVRAGDTISVTNYPNNSPRLIVETSYDDESKMVTLSIDRPFALLDAYLDRVGVALTARGLT